MRSFSVETPQRVYPVVVEGGATSRLGAHLPSRAGKVFVVSTEDVWRLHGGRISDGLQDRPYSVLYFVGGEERKRLSEVEALAEQMAALGGDRTSVVVAFGGGIVCDLAGFLAASFMRGVPVVQVPTTLLAQVDAGVGGKTGVNLVSGKNLLGAFHQPLAVLIDPGVLKTLPPREYRAGLFEVLKTGIIRSEALFRLMVEQRDEVLSLEPCVLEEMITQSVEIKAAVVSADEREGGLRRILNFGHTFGHALEAESGYSRFLHGEAVGFGMRAATYLASLVGMLNERDKQSILDAIHLYGPVPSTRGIRTDALVARLARDKKTVQGAVHFVLPEAIGQVRVVTGVDEELVAEATRTALRELEG